MTGPEESRAEKRGVSLILKDHPRVPLRVATGKGAFLPDSGILLLTPLRLFDMHFRYVTFLRQKRRKPRTIFERSD